MAGEIFISYRRADQDKARLLHALLKQRGIDAWYDGLLGPGDDWRRKTAQALEAAPIFVLMFSKVASESDDISKELAAATFSKKLVVPVRIENIKPTGAFLYELASRNWIDAWDDTEAKFADLADKLTAIVRGGASAEVAAFNLGAPGPPPQIAPPKKPWFTNPALLGGVAALALAAIAGVFFLTHEPAPPTPPAPPGQTANSGDARIAFFGFAAAGDDPVAAEMARTATDETFTTLDALSLQTIARGVTEGASLTKQIEQARTLGARYALAGDVRKQGDGYTMSIRLDDTRLGAALWQKTLPAGTAAQKLSLPIQAATEATRTAQCFTDYRPSLEAETEKALALLRRICANPERNLELIGALRELSQLTPHSAFVSGQYAGFELATIALVPPAERAARIEEARQALARAKKVDADNAWVIQAEAFFGYLDGRPLAEIATRLRTALDKDPDRPILLIANRDLMTAVGRQQDALGYAERVRQRTPLNSIANWTTARLLLQTGRAGDASALFETAATRFPTRVTWLDWVQAAAFSPEGNVARALRQRPASVSDETFACARDIATAAASRVAKVRLQGAARVSACIPATPPSMDAVYMLAALGDVDGAYRIEQAFDRTTPLAYLNSTNTVFYQAARPMREDSRFKQLTVDRGLWQYWIDTKSLPDICTSAAERDAAFCSGLRAAQAGK